jgi:hypothetical protein
VDIPDEEPAGDAILPTSAPLICQVLRALHLHLVLERTVCSAVEDDVGNIGGATRKRLKEGNDEITTQHLTINNYQSSHHHIDTSVRIIDTGLETNTISRESSINTGRISQIAKAHNKMKQDSKLFTLFDAVETAVQIIFMTGLNGDLRWMWNKSQGKYPAGLTPLRMNRVEDPKKRDEGKHKVWDSVLKLMKSIADLEIEETNQVETKAALCNTSAIENNRSFKASQIHLICGTYLL